MCRWGRGESGLPNDGSTVRHSVCSWKDIVDLNVVKMTQSADIDQIVSRN